MSEIKLTADSGGGSVSFKGPATTTGNADVPFVLPVADGGAGEFLKTDGSKNLSFVGGSSIQVLEQFFSPADGSVMACQKGDVTLENPSASLAATTSWVDLPGSAITYTPPDGTTQVIYEFCFNSASEDTDAIASWQFLIDGTLITDCRNTQRMNTNYYDQPQQFKWAVNIGGSDSDATGRRASWSSDKTLKLQFREYDSNREWHVNYLRNYAGTAVNVFRRPSVGITAIGVPS